jgi:methylated-DNA-[protein]-cysteine S-methyltransferase
MSEAATEVWQHLFETPFGWVGLLVGPVSVWTLSMGCQDPKCCSDRLASEAETIDVAIQTGAMPRGVEKFAKAVEKKILRYADGAKVELGGIAVQLHARTPFQTRVLKACHEIPRGKTLTYQQLAEIAGSPKACRAVGNIMAKNKIPLLIPCHRVVGSHGGLGGFSAPQGISLKEQLLRLEGSFDQA